MVTEGFQWVEPGEQFSSQWQECVTGLHISRWSRDQRLWKEPGVRYHLKSPTLVYTSASEAPIPKVSCLLPAGEACKHLPMGGQVRLNCSRTWARYPDLRSCYRGGQQVYRSIRNAKWHLCSAPKTVEFWDPRAWFPEFLLPHLLLTSEALCQH